MDNFRLTFNSSTNFTLPISVFQILQQDAYYYGYIKNQKPNICGFLNNLIPTLSNYQKNLFKELTKYNKGNVELAKICARSIHNVYLYPFLFNSDGVVNVPFRINKEKYSEFLTIHDEYLSFYDTDFTKYVRTLLSEYASKTLSQREYLYAFEKIIKIRNCIPKGQICKFYTQSDSSVFVPVSIETSPIFNHNYVVGIDKDKNPIAIRLCNIHNLTILNESIKITDDMCKDITEYLDNIYEKEYSECLN